MRSTILCGEFKDYTSQWDGVTYPDINNNIPYWVQDYVFNRLKEIMGGPITPIAFFARATTKNTPAAPHKIHSDKLMAQFSAHVYISKDWPKEAGTSFWIHNEAGDRHTEETDVESVAKDCNDLSKWVHSFTCQGRFNRLLIHDASYWHCAEPIGGWGDEVKDGRVVLTCFFDAGQEVVSG